MGASSIQESQTRECQRMEYQKRVCTFHWWTYLLAPRFLHGILINANYVLARSYTQSRTHKATPIWFTVSPFIRKPGACGRAVHYSLSLHVLERQQHWRPMPKLLLDNEIGAGILIHYNEQNLEIVERMRAGNGKQVIILEWPNINRLEARQSINGL